MEADTNNGKGENLNMKNIFLFFITILLISCFTNKHYETVTNKVGVKSANSLYIYHCYENTNGIWYEWKQKSKIEAYPDSIMLFEIYESGLFIDQGYIVPNRFILAQGVFQIKAAQFNYIVSQIEINDNLNDFEEKYRQHGNYDLTFMDTLTMNGVKLYVMNGFENGTMVWHCEKYGVVLIFDTEDSTHCNSYLANTFNPQSNREVRNLLDSIYIKYYHLPPLDTNPTIFNRDKDTLPLLGRRIELL